MKNIYKLILSGFSLLAVSCNGKFDEDIADNYIKVSPESIEATCEEKIVNITVEANCNWTVSKTNADGSASDWIKVDKISGKGSTTFNIKVSYNNTAEERSGSVDVKGENASAFITVKQEANPSPEDPDEPDTPIASTYDMPVYQMFENGGKTDVPSGEIATFDPEFTNATVEGNTVTFNDGLVIEKTGSAGNIMMACPTHTNPKADAGFQLGICADFTPGESWIFKIPMKNELSGDLRFTYGSRKEGISDAAPYSWSTDEGATWQPVTKMEAAVSDAAFKSVWFTISHDKKVEAGKSLWFKIDQTAAKVYLQNGITLDYATAPLSDLPAQDVTSTVISEGFDATVEANGAFLEVPGFMKSMTTDYTSNGTDKNGLMLDNQAITYSHCSARPGFVQVGYHDESLVARCGWNGEITIAVGDRLKEMGIESTNLKLSFKAAGLTNAYNVTGDAKVIVKSNGATVGRVDNLSINWFNTYSFTIAGADQNTVLAITSDTDVDKPVEGATSFGGVSTVASDMADFRFFVDDILVEVDNSSPLPEEDKVLEFDFTTCPDGWPVTDKREHVEGGVKCYYNLGGTDYEFVLADALGASSDRVYWHSSGYIIWASYYRYLGLPAINGYRLTKIDCLHATTTKAGRMMGVATEIVEADAEKVTYVEGGTPVEFAEQGVTYSFNLSGTAAGTVYYLYCSALGVGVSKITLTYSK